MKGSLITLLVTLLLGLFVAYYFYAGGYNIAATQPHTGPVEWFLGELQENSIRTQAATLEAPPLQDSEIVQIGLSHYHQMCVTCHGAPGIEPSETGKGLYPPPPNLSEAVEEFSEAELFWIVKNGLKMTGMPAYGPTHDDKSLWGIVAFLEELPEISEGEYREMVTKSGLAPPSGGHGADHTHGESSGPSEDAVIGKEKGHSHETGSDPHNHNHEDSPNNNR